MLPPTAVHLLVVEDDPSHAALLRATFRRLASRTTLAVVEDGQLAIDYLRGVGIYHDRETHPEPDLMILDLGLPVVSGFEVLEWMEGEGSWGALPVVVFSSSVDPRDAERAFALGARAFKKKPADFRELVDLVGELLARWAPGPRKDAAG